MNELFNLIPIFLDWTGTINEILSTNKELGAKKLKNFFDSIKNLENETNSKALITIITGGSLSNSKARLNILNELSTNYHMPNLFPFIIAEYCGYLVESNGSTYKLDSIPTDLLEKKETIKNVLNPSANIKINSDIKTYINLVFPDEIERKDYISYTEKIKELVGNNYDFLASFDEYGKEFDIKSKTTTKQRAVTSMMPIILDKYPRYHIPFILTGGDTEQEDLPMALADTGEIKIIPIAPNNHNIHQEIIDKLNVIVGNGSNIEGITDSINTISKIGRTR